MNEATREFIRQHRQEDVRLYQDIALIRAVETAYNLPALLQHGLLVLSHGNRGGLESADVCSLGNRICEEPHGETATVVVLCLRTETAHYHLRLHGGVALEALHRYQVGEELRHLMEFRNAALDEDGYFLRVQTAREVVQGYLYHVLANFLRVVCIVCKGLNIGDENEHAVVIAFILDEDPVAQGTYIVAKMQLAGGSVAGKNYSAHYSLFCGLLFRLLLFEDGLGGNCLGLFLCLHNLYDTGS